MGFLEDLIKTVQEAVDESRQGQGPVRPPPRPPPLQRRPAGAAPTPAPPSQDAAEATAIRERLQRRYEEARRLETQAEDLRQRQRDQDAAISVVEKTATSGAARSAEAAGTAPILSRATGWWRATQLLHDRRSIREAILLKEILDRPLSLRHRHR